ncbi:MAG: hypothetical protein HQ559_02715 [Lentisphaerae bacterium]|nr:hypothetical protein [Lentisphaerota bacterium]
MKSVLDYPGVFGDGKHDDSAGLQAALDSGEATLCFPTPPGNYLISRTLVIHSNQTLMVERNAVIRLADHAHVHMLTNSDHAAGNTNITVLGGIWDGNNEHQTCEYHQGKDWRVPYDPKRYLGVLMQLNRVKNLRIANLTLKDPEMFGIQAGNLYQFSVEDVTFDYNMLRANMDGVHLHGPCRHGRLVNLKGATNDDMIALNADDGQMAEMSRGPIEDIQVDGLWSENGYTAVRLLSAGSPVCRIKIANIFGTFRTNIVSFTNHKVHPGTLSTFDDISIEGVFCSKASMGEPAGPPKDVWSGHAQIWIDAPAAVSNLLVRDYHRTETAVPADDIHIEPGASVDNLVLSEVSLTNRCGRPIVFLHNRGAIGSLGLQHVYAKAEVSGGVIVRNTGTIGRVHQIGITVENFDVGI